MPAVTATSSGTFAIGGDRPIHRLGFGAMRITGRGVWGEPQDRAEALRTLRALPELGVNFVDTADSYGPEVSEKLIREALHPYKGILIATKGGLERPGPDNWVNNGKPDRLIAQAKRSRELLGVEQIELWQLHRIDPKVPRDEQFAAVKQLIGTGVIRHAGLSEVSVGEIKAAQKVFPVATYRIATTSVTAQAKTSSPFASSTPSDSSRGTRWERVRSRSQAVRSKKLPSATARHWARSLSHGF